jgi:thioredoxin reductase (NADPH)
MTATESLRFDCLYPAFGCDPRSGLARSLGVRLDEQACVVTDAHQRTSVKGLYAAGDVVSTLDQISVAMGQAAVAATAIHNDLPKASYNSAT